MVEKERGHRFRDVDMKPIKRITTPFFARVFKTWLLVFVASFGLNLPLLIISPTPEAWAEERVTDDGKTDEVVVEERVTDDGKTDEVVVEERVTDDGKSDQVLIEKKPLEIDGTKTEATVKTFEIVDDFGRVIQVISTEYVDPITGAVITSEEKSVRGSEGLDEKEILETFGETDRRIILSSLLSGKPSEAQERLLASLTDEEKSALFESEKFLDKTTNVILGDVSSIARALSFDPDIDLSIGASGDDSVVVDFDPTSTAKSSQKVLEVAVSASVVASSASVATASASFASSTTPNIASAVGGSNPPPGSPNSPAPSNSSAPPARQRISGQNSASTTPKGGGTGAGGGGQSLGENPQEYLDVNEDVYDALAVADYQQTSRSQGSKGKFEQWFTSRFGRIFLSFDKAMHSLQTGTNRLPIAGKLLEDSSYLRAFVGPMYLVLPLVSLLLGAWSALNNAQALLHPPIVAYLTLILIGVFDTFSGFVGISTFVLLTVQHFDFISLEDWRTVAGVVLSCVGPALITRSIVGFRRRRNSSSLSRVRDFSDLLFSALIGGWVASIMVRALPSLSGLSLPAANHLDTVQLLATLGFVIRVGLEILVSRVLPSRLGGLTPSKTTFESNFRVASWLSIRFGFLILLGSSFLGFGWEVWVISGTLIIPNVLGVLAERLPQSENLWKLFPYGVLGVASILAIEVCIESVLTYTYSGSDFTRVFMLFLAPAIAIFAVCQLLARPASAENVHWWETLKSPKLKFVSALALWGGLLFITRLL